MIKSILQNFKYTLSFFEVNLFFFIFLKFIPITSHERQIELFQQYTNDDLGSYTQSTIDWQSMFHCLQDYRQKSIEQSIEK